MCIRDRLGTEEAKFVSLTQYAGNPLLTTVIAALIVFGGLGFLTWEDICTSVSYTHLTHAAS